MYNYVTKNLHIKIKIYKKKKNSNNKRKCIQKSENAG